VQTKTADRYLWLLAGLSIILLFPSLGSTHLWIYDEVRNAECAREMWERNDWIVPTFNGKLRDLKPPLHYYFMFGGFEMFGTTEWGARFFSAVFGMLTILLTYYFTARYSNKLHAFISCCILLASTHWLFEHRMSVPDPYLIFFNTLTIFSAYAYFTEQKFRWILICAVASGLGMLAKGPVAIVLPGLAVLLWVILERKSKMLAHWHLVVAFFVMIAVALPWYVMVHNATNGEWTRGFFIEHNVGRFSEPMEGHGGLFVIVPLFVLLGLLPGSIFIGESMKKFRKLAGNSFWLLSFMVLVIFVVFYSISGTKLPNYPMPCYSFGAIVIGYYVSRAYERKARRKSYPYFILFLINLIIPIGLFIGVKNEIEMAGFEKYTLLTIILTLAAIVSFIVYKRNGFRRSVKTLFIWYTCFNLVFFNYLYPTIYQNNPLSKTVYELKRYDKAVGYKIFHPSFTYYLPDRVTVFEDKDSLNAYLKLNPALVLTREEYLPELTSLKLDTVAIHHDIFESSTTSLLTNQKK
jgi:4-amino-4-deoxy-L-arabinose transferase-like glycosyltransferase